MAVWTIVVEALKNAYSVYKQYQDKEKAGRAWQRFISEILSALERVGEEVVSEIVQELRTMQLADLRGDILGLEIRFAEYDRRDPKTEHAQWEIEGSRLAGVVVDSATLIGHLESELGMLDLNLLPDLLHAGRVFSLYATVVPFRGIALVEHHYWYNIDTENDTKLMLTRARDRAEWLLPKMRSGTDARFSKDIVIRPGEPLSRERGQPPKRWYQVGYMLDQSFRLVTVAVARAENDESLDDARRKVREALEKHKEELFLSSGGNAALEVLAQIPEQIEVEAS